MEHVSKKQASITLTDQRNRDNHSSFLINTLLRKTNDEECNTFTSELNPDVPGPPVFGDEEKYYWAWRTLKHKDAVIGSARGRVDVEKLLRLIRGACNTDVIPTAKQIANGQDIIEGYNLQIGLLSQSEYKDEYGDKDGMFPCKELTEYQTNQTKEGKNRRTITFLARTDGKGRYDEHSAVMALSNYVLEQGGSWTGFKPGNEHLFRDYFRDLTKIPITGMTFDERVVPAKSGPFDIDDYVLSQEEFDTVEEAEEYTKDFDEQGYSITNKGKEVLDKLRPSFGELTVRKEGTNFTHQYASSRNVLKHMRGGKDPSPPQRELFNARLKKHNLHRTNTRADRNSFINPSKMDKDVVVEKDEFGANATYIINGVLV